MVFVISIIAINFVRVLKWLINPQLLTCPIFLCLDTKRAKKACLNLAKYNNIRQFNIILFLNCWLPIAHGFAYSPNNFSSAALFWGFTMRLFYALSLAALLLAYRVYAFEGYYGWDDMAYAEYAAQWIQGRLSLSDTSHFVYRWGIIAPLAFFYRLGGINDITTTLHHNMLLIF